MTSLKGVFALGAAACVLLTSYSILFPGRSDPIVTCTPPECAWRRYKGYPDGLDYIMTSPTILLASSLEHGATLPHGKRLPWLKVKKDDASSPTFRSDLDQRCRDLCKQVDGAEMSTTHTPSTSKWKDRCSCYKFEESCVIWNHVTSDRPEVWGYTYLTTNKAPCTPGHHDEA